MSSSFAPPTAEQSFDGAGASGGGTNAVVPVAQFREIHKNTWLKRLTADGKKVTVGPKKSDRTWVVFCVHDDTEALLEGYAEPRQAGSHSPEWMVRLQDTLHISHALIPNSHEFEFVVTLSNEVMRFHAMSWEIMQEWVETLRSKLREMKILSPRENLYTKLPEIRAPLLPTRDPTSPLPAPPPVPAALVPGTEIVTTAAAATSGPNGNSAATATQPQADESTENAAPASRTLTTLPSTSAGNWQPPTAALPTTSTPAVDQPTTSSVLAAPASLFIAMSNTLSQNLLNMLSDPISAYSEQLHEDNGDEDDDDDEADESDDDDDGENDEPSSGARLKHSNLLRGGLENSVRLDVAHEHRMSADQLKNLSSLIQCDRRIPRPQTSRSLSAGAADKSRTPKAAAATKPSKELPHLAAELRASASKSNNITELEVAPAAATSACGNSKATVSEEDSGSVGEAKTNITIIQVSESGDAETEASAPPPKLPLKTITADIFKFPDTETPSTSASTSIKLSKPSSSHQQVEYKSNVQIIPSNANSSTIQVLGGGDSNSVGGSGGMTHVSTTVANQYSSPQKKVVKAGEHQQQQQQHNANSVTSVHCPGEPTTTSAAANTSAISVYGTCYNNGPALDGGTPKMPKKIILSANTSGVTNISVNNDVTTATATTTAAGSSKLAIRAAAPPSECVVSSSPTMKHYEKVFLSSNIAVTGASEPTSMSTAGLNSATTAEANEIVAAATTTAIAVTKSPKWNGARRPHGEQTTPKVKAAPGASVKSTVRPAAHERLTSPSNRTPASGAPLSQPPLPSRPPFLTRGLTEAVISTRPSRKDFHFLKLTPAKTKSQSGNNAKTTAAAAVQHSGPNNNAEGGASSATAGNPLAAHHAHAAVNRTNSDCLEHRRRSSSTSDARNGRSASTNNNEHHPGRNYVMAGHGPGGGSQPGVLRIQQPPHVVGGTPSSGPANNSSPSTKRMTLREQQVMQLRREIMHPGGVRLQLRRKDCIGSIAWVDAFGAVWVAGWKQKECPVLYNALHIGDQLLSIAGVTVSSATEANKIIRNSNTLFVEMLVRRIPFGRGYAIRRDREGQCLGLIRDGNTATIVDVVPNSLAARHGLPPKAQSCDGASLTFWVMTEINGRPLNLFFKDNEIRDRLNSVGRDISILVQPADLIAKLKKQLKSLRGYKDYLVQ